MALPKKTETSAEVAPQTTEENHETSTEVKKIQEIETINQTGQEESIKEVKEASLSEEATFTPLERSASALHSFEAEVIKPPTPDEDAMAPFSVSALGLAFQTVVKAVKKNQIPNYELVKLLDVLPIQQEVQEFDAEFDISQELTTQLKTLKSMRDKIFSIDGRLAEGSSIKDAKDFMASSAQLLQMLQKSREAFLNLDRLQAIEDATIESIRELDEETTKRFLALLEEKLERIA